MTEFKRNKKTGIVEVWRDGKHIGEVITMGDEVMKDERDLHQPRTGNADSPE